MSRRHNPDLNRPWKIVLPATLAGRVEFLLINPIHNKPIYAARSKLVAALLEWYIAREGGQDLPHIPSIDELRNLN